MKKSIVLLITVFVLLAAALPMAAAQDADIEAVATLTFSEAEINSAYWITNPANRHLSEVSVDLQSANGGQLVVSMLYTWRPLGQPMRSVRIVATFVPEVVNGRLIWNLTAATADGTPATAAQVRELNTYIAGSWSRWVQTHAPAGTLTGVSISDSDITFTYTPRL